MRCPRLLAALVVAHLVAVSPAAAAPPHAGSFDRSFGDRGRVTLKFQGERIAPAAVVVQPDRRIVVAGTVVGAPDTYPGGGAGDVVAFRFLPDGDLDPSFGEAGVARARFSTPVRIQGLALQPDGALLLTGATFTPDSSWIGAVVRLLPSGRVDEAFGSGGISTVPSAAESGYTRGVKTITHAATQRDGRIVAAGSQDPLDVHSRADPYVIRLLPNGTPDPSFDSDGRASIGTSNPIAVLSRPSGDLVVVGWDEDYFGGAYLTLLSVSPGANAFPFPHNPSNAFAYHRYDSSFTGIAATVRPDGTIDVVGSLVNYARPDRRFLVHPHIGHDLELLDEDRVLKKDLLAATFDSRGSVLTAGSWLYPYDPPPFRIERFRNMHRLDRSFGNRRGARNVFFERPGALTGMAMQGNKLIVAGYTHVERQLFQGISLTLARLHARQDGSGPRLYVKHLRGNRCLSEPTTLLVIARDGSRTTTRVSLDRRRVTTSTRHRFRFDLDASELKPGRHRLRIHSVDAAGNRSATSRRLRVCG